MAQISKSESISQASWQQQVDHSISVSLDPASKMLRCEEDFTYTNNSPDVLYFIRMHVWPNAFANNRTPYGKEAVVNGNNSFLEANREKRGFLDSLDFSSNGTPLKWAYLAGETEILEVQLAAALQPGQSVTIHTPFRVKIPFLFSRMGFSGSLFSITQWYPKPAVYDVNGWNTFPYQEQGEYYSEFGRYEVKITLPANYIVGATGELQNEDEKEWLTELADGTAEKRPETELKTLVFVQDKVPDFAWFADPTFQVGEADVALASGKSVHTYALISGSTSASSRRVLESIETALTYYGKRVGEYPYGYCTAVIGELKAAGGMEYPMITICGDASSGTVIHEVGHNWFQCVLGSQERRYPWMDESVNTFYQNQAEGNAPKEWDDGKRIQTTGAYMSYRLAQDYGVFQAGNLHSSAYQGNNYGVIVYTANPMRFSYLQEFLGKKMFDSCMHVYFRNWQFRHPLPGDMQAAFEQTTGKNMDWFFKGLMGDQLSDAGIKSVKKSGDGYEIRIKNEGEIPVPVKLEYSSGKKSSFVWVTGKDTTVYIPKAEKLRLNPSGFYTESDFENNEARTKGLFKKSEKIKLGLPDLTHRGQNRIWILPQPFAGNLYDGYMPGLVISNIELPRKKLEWWLYSAYGTGSKNLVGSAGIRRNLFFQKGPFAMAEVFITCKSYNYMPDTSMEMHQYGRINLGEHFFLKRHNAWVQHIFGYEVTSNRIIEIQGLVQTKQSNLPVNGDYQNDLYKLFWNRIGYKKSLPTDYMVTLEAGNNTQPYMRKQFSGDSSSFFTSAFGFVKLSGSAKWYVPYHFFKKPGSGLRIQLFGAAMLHTIKRESTQGAYNPVISGARGVNDYAYSETLIGRSATLQNNPLWGRQLLSNTAGIRMIPGITSSKYAFGTNITSAIAPYVPIKVFLDAVVGDANNKATLYWATGLSVGAHWLNNTIVEFNFPLKYSSNFNSAMSGYKWYQTWNFKLNISMFEPTRVIRQTYR